MLKNSDYAKLLCLIFLFIATVVGATVYSVVDYDKYEGHQVFLILDDFSGGLNSKFPADVIRDNESPDLLNVRLTSFGGVGKRPSYSKYNSTAVSEEIDSTYRYYEQDGTKNTLIQFDTGLLLGNDAAGTFASKDATITDGARLDYCTSHNVVYMTNESDVPLSYYGVSNDVVFAWGCTVPVVTSTTLAQGTDGALDTTAEYKYKITYLYYGYEESSGSASVDTTLIDANDEIDLSSIPLGDARVTARKIYRTEGDGAVYYLLTTLSDNTDTTYEDKTADTSLDTANICPTDNGLPPSGCQYTFLAANRVFLVDINESKYYYSGLDTPDIFPSANYDYVFRDDGEYLKGYAYWKGIIYWFKNTYITATVPQGAPSQWSTAKTIGRIAYPGTISGWSIAPSPAGIYYTAPDNIYLFNGSYSQPIKEGIENEIKDINSTYYSLIDSIWWNNTYRLTYVSTLAGGTTPNRQIIWDEFRKAYVMDDKTITCYQVWNGNGDDNQLYAGLTTGYLIQEEGTAESYNPFIHNTATELATGTLSYVETGGTEASPTLVLDDDTLPTNTLAGTLTSAVQSITAYGIGRTYFNKQVSGSSDAQVYLRTGNVVTPDATWTDWEEITDSGDYPATTSEKDYLQYKAVLTGEWGTTLGSEHLTNPDFTGSADDWTLENTPVLGDEKITNGTFTGSATGWTLETFTYGSNAVSFTYSGSGGYGAVLYQIISSMVTPLVLGESYRLQFTLSNCTGNQEFIFSCGGLYRVIPLVNGTYTYDFICTNITQYPSFQPYGGSAMTLTIDNISLKKIDYTSKNAYQPIANMVTALAVGGFYKLQVNVTDYVSDSIVVTCGGNTLGTITANGTYTYEFTCSDVTDYLNFATTASVWTYGSNKISAGGITTYLSIDSATLKKFTNKITSNTSLITTDGYFIKVGLGFRSSGESTIDFEYKTKEFDLRENGLAPHKKTYTEYIIEYDSEDTGTLYMDYWIDEVLQTQVSIDLSAHPKRYHTFFESGADIDIGRKIQFYFTESSINDFQLNRATITFEPQPINSD